MPNYDFGCSKCDFVLRDLFLPLAQHRDKITADCPNHGLTTFEQVLTCPVIEDWGNEGPEGRFFEHLGPKGMRFRDKAAYKRHLRENGLVEWAPRTGMPGSGV